MDFPMSPKDAGRWEVDDDPATDPDKRSAQTGQTHAPQTEPDATSPGADTGAGNDPYGSTTGETASRHSAGPSGFGQSSGTGPDAIRDDRGDDRGDGNS